MMGYMYDTDNNLFQNKYRIKTARWTDWDYSWDGCYFVTICVRGRECCLGEIVDGEMKLSALGEIVEKFWLQITDGYQNVASDEYIVMPNHIHGIIAIHCDERNQTLENVATSQGVAATIGVETIHELSLRQTPQTPLRIRRRNMTLSKLIGRFKMQSAKEINLIRGTMGEPFWQSRFHDRVIRNEHQLANVRKYIFNNPVKWASDRNNPINIARPIIPKI